jgi:RNA polymerase sigma-70 factor (ECF subfamily)
MTMDASFDLDLTARVASKEAEYVQRARSGDEDAWVTIYEQHYPTLYRYVRARVEDRETAEDLTATVFLEAVRGIGGYRDRGRPFLAWLYTIARNTVNYHRRAGYRRPAGAPLGDPAGTPGGGDPASAAVRLDVRRAVAELSKDQREVMILRHFVGLTTPEVSRLLGKHERAVYSLQTRAIKALRKRLG